MIACQDQRDGCRRDESLYRQATGGRGLQRILPLLTVDAPAEDDPAV